MNEGSLSSEMHDPLAHHELRISQTCSRSTTSSVGTDVHRARRCADGHGDRCRNRGREPVHARAHVHGYEFELICASACDCGAAYENGSLS